MKSSPKTTPFLSLLIILCFTPPALGLIGTETAAPARKLFVFGDSYSDTGNWKQGTGLAWNPPYGSTFPGKPAGRFSDGRILTDFMASYLGIRSPQPYEQGNRAGSQRVIKFGINFAYGGAGVFDANVSGPNITTQIDSFQNLLEKENAYTKQDLESSVALVTLGGNDYSHFLNSGGSLQDIHNFSISVVKQLALDVSRIHSLGVPKIAVTGLEPLGCVPAISTFLLYRNCSDVINDIARFHNNVLKNAVGELNKQVGDPPAFLVLDLYQAFLFGLKKGNTGYENPLKPCCEGVSSDHSCGSREGAEAKYTVCPNPRAAFFWDAVHPTQNGWLQVFMFFKRALKTFF